MIGFHLSVLVHFKLSRYIFKFGTSLFGVVSAGFYRALSVAAVDNG